MAPKTAVIIDDEPDITTYFSTLLTDAGWKVRTANDPNEGITLAREDPPAVVMLDVMMPERGGLSTLIALRKDERTAKIPVVLVTGIQESLKADFGDFLDRFKKYHPDAYLQKPINEDELLQTLAKVTGE
ncbi:MAG: response regulator [Acidobacteria bacterium]|jgi:CheY-like chemotaxis protein|nr:response regulator [Acidobacteriota bacterium]